MSKRAKTAAAPSPTQPPTQLFSGLSLFCLNLPPKVAELQQGLVSRRGGTLTVLTADVKERLAAAPPAEELLVLCESGGSRLDDLRAWAAKAGLPLRVCTYDWVGKSIQLGVLQRTEAFEVWPASPVLEAPPPPPSTAAVLPARAERDATPPRDEEDRPAPAFGDSSFVPPPRTGELCSLCRGALEWNEISACQACIKQHAPSSLVAQTRALHLRYPVIHPNKRLVAAIQELADFEELFGTDHAHQSAKTFNRVAAMLKATVRDICTVEDLHAFDPPFIQGKSAEVYIPQYLNTGEIERLQIHRRQPKRVAALRLSKLPYVGPTLAKHWADRGWLTPEEVLLKMPASEQEKLTQWQKLVLQHSDDLLSDISVEERLPLVKLVEDAMAAADPTGGLNWRFVGGTARGKSGGHDLDFMLSHQAHGGEAGHLERMLNHIAASDAVEHMAVCLSYGSAGDSAGDGGVNARGFSAGNMWSQGQTFGSADKDANKALCLIKLKGRKMRHIDLLMVPKSDLAFWISAWIGSRELRRLLSLHARTLHCRGPDAHPQLQFKLNQMCLYGFHVTSDGQMDPSYLPRRVTRLGVDAPLVPETHVEEEYVAKKMYPVEEREVWDLLQLPWRPFCDRNA